MIIRPEVPEILGGIPPTDAIKLSKRADIINHSLYLGGGLTNPPKSEKDSCKKTAKATNMIFRSLIKFSLATFKTVLNKDRKMKSNLTKEEERGREKARKNFLNRSCNFIGPEGLTRDHY